MNTRPPGRVPSGRRLYLWAALALLIAAPLAYLVLRRAGPPQSAAVGVAECDDYLTKMEACLPNMEPPARAAAGAALKQKREQWISSAAAGGAAKDALRATCIDEAGAMPVQCGPTGIWACDLWLSKMESCIPRMDPAGRAVSEASFKQTRDAWQAAKRSGANQELLQQGCEAAVAALPSACR